MAQQLGKAEPLVVGLPRFKEWRWNMHNRLRRVVRMQAVARPCCRKVDKAGERVNLGPPTVSSPDGKITVRRCLICHARHFEAEAPKGAIGVKV